MTYLRLTYTVCQAHAQTQWEGDHHHELIGPPETIFDLWFHLSQLENLHTTQIHPSACPRFLHVFNKDGKALDPKQGLDHLIAFS